MRIIAAAVERAPSTVSREIARKISHETIYRTLFIQARGALNKDLIAHLRTRRMMRRSKKASTRDQPRGRIVDAVSISERPAETVVRALISQVKRLPSAVRLSLTWDRGMELARHKEFSIATDVAMQHSPH